MRDRGLELVVERHSSSLAILQVSLAKVSLPSFFKYGSITWEANGRDGNLYFFFKYSMTKSFFSLVEFPLNRTAQAYTVAWLAWCDVSACSACAAWRSACAWYWLERRSQYWGEGRPCTMTLRGLVRKFCNLRMVFWSMVWMEWSWMKKGCCKFLRPL